MGFDVKSESLAFASMIVVAIVVIYLMAVGFNESFYGRWRSNRCICTNVMCRCAGDQDTMLRYA